MMSLVYGGFDGLLGTLEAAGAWFSFPMSSTLDDVK
jgi:hypothetical protein